MLRNEKSKVTFLGRKVFHLLNYRWNLGKKSLRICGLKNNPHLCSAFHFEQADSTANIAVGIFYAHGLSYSSVPCGALMRPLPVQGGMQRGAELFLFPSRNNQHIVSF